MAVVEIFDFLFIFMFCRILDSTNQCPMCAEIVDSNRLNDVENVASYLSGLSQATD